MLNRQADAAPSRLDTDLLSILTHELRTPLSALHATLELLDDLPTLPPDEAGQLVRHLQRGVAWLDCLIGNLTTWAALERGQLLLDLQPVQVSALIDQALTVVQPILSRRSQQVQVDDPADSPRVNADGQRLVQVLVNLLANASAYSPPGGMIHLVVSVDAGQAIVEVRDTGPGVPPDERERIFERYVQGTVTSTQHTSGMGLGLYIVKTLITLHGGAVGVDNHAGGGASFWLRVPCLAEQSDANSEYSILSEEPYESSIS